MHGKSHQTKNNRVGHVCAVRAAATRTLKDMGIDQKKKILYGARSTGVKQGEETEVNMDTITDKKPNNWNLRDYGEEPPLVGLT